ncbi:MAG: hypothetical protein Q4E56_01325, partial [Pseudomonadota bacterium]|nr:hypothetical protein [Pseudomonadota bacterium]
FKVQSSNNVCAKWRTGLFTGLLRCTRNDKGTSWCVACGLAPLPHPALRLDSLRASVARRGNPVLYNVARSAQNLNFGV